ncbi:MAG: DNA recombination protein RmuC [Anaerolineae bacterium]|nr:DNA recombination protein RmuC [Anaerolineae bacterium]
MIYLMAGALIGGILVYIVMYASTANLRAELKIVEGERKQRQDQELWLQKTREEMKTTFEALAGNTLRQNSRDFLGRTQSEMQLHRSQMEQLVSPLQAQVESLGSAVRDIERRREGAFAGLDTQLKHLLHTHQLLQTTTTELSQAMRSSTIRGRWGELQLRRVVELADMIEHVDFDVQMVNSDQQRPDMLIRLPNLGELPVDAKAPMSAYLSALSATSEQDRKQKLTQHVQDVRGHIKTLRQRNYQGKLKNAPQFVVMFVPNEACLSAAFEFDPSLMEDAMSQQVLIVTPITLLALLRSAAFGWQQQRLAQDANLIAEKGKELYKRAKIFADHLRNLRKNLSQTVDCFNQAVASLETRLLPAGRELGKLTNADGKDNQIDNIEMVELNLRLVQTQEGDERMLR